MLMIERGRDVGFCASITFNTRLREKHGTAQIDVENRVIVSWLKIEEVSANL